MAALEAHPVSTRIIVADVMAGLGRLADQSVQCVITSPPYWNLRDYGVSGQIGLERTPAEYVERMVRVFRETRRVLRHDGLLWLNMGDSYIARRGGKVGDNSTLNGSRHTASEYRKAKALRRCHHADTGLKHKDLVGMPWRLALALQDDGWWLRRDIIWAKPNGTPESVTDRPSTSHEYIFLLSSSSRYFYDQDAFLEPYAYGLDHHRNVIHDSKPSHMPGAPVHRGLQKGIKRPSGWDGDPTARHDQVGTGRYRSGNKERKVVQRGPNGDNSLGSSIPWQATGDGRPARSVWTFSVAPYAQHFATFPPELPRRCILLGTSAMGCCGACGAPLARQVRHRYIGSRRHGTGSATGRRMDARYGGRPSNEQGGAGLPRLERVTDTLGWKRACRCDAGIVPCVVLDPFSGAGTTSLVAGRLGRDSVGIELNPEYAALSERRLYGDSPVFAGVTVE